MDFHRNPSANSASSSTSSTSSAAAHHQPPPSSATDNDPMQSWWESVSKQRSRILSLAALLPSDGVAVSSLADSDRPAVSLLSSPSAYSLISSALSSPKSGSGSDRLCQWLYETFESSDPHLRLLVLSFLPLLSGIYLSRVHSSDSSSLPSLAGFEAVLLAVYSSEAKSRAGKPLLVQIPDLSQPSLYHAPRNKPVDDRSRQSVGVLSPPLEPHLAVKSTKRAIIVGTALDCYYKQVSQMPAWSKLDLCKFAAAWAGQDCPCRTKLDRDEDNHHENGNVNGNGHIRLLREDSGFSNGTRSGDGDEVDYEDDVIKEVVVVEMNNLGINEENLETKGVRIPLPWELLRPVVTILGHCLFGPLNSQDVKDSASVAVRCLYARASHDLAPQAILALQSLIRLDKNARAAATTAATVTTNASSNANTPSKAKKPEILLVSK